MAAKSPQAGSQEALEQALTELNRSMKDLRRHMDKTYDEMQVASARVLTEADKVAALARDVLAGAPAVTTAPPPATPDVAEELDDDLSPLPLPKGDAPEPDSQKAADNVPIWESFDDLEPPPRGQTPPPEAVDVAAGRPAPEPEPEPEAPTAPPPLKPQKKKAEAEKPADAIAEARESLRRSGTYRPRPEDSPLQRELGAVGITSFPDADIPMVPAVLDCNEAFRNMATYCLELPVNPLSPKTSQPLPPKLVEDTTKGKDRLLHDFNGMQETARTLVRKRYDSLKDKLPRDSDAKLFWGSDLVHNYVDYRTIRYVELLLDTVERAIEEEHREAGYELLDQLARFAGLERLQVVPGETKYHGYYHQLAPSQADLGYTPDDETISRVARSGYLDKSRKRVVRRVTIEVDVDGQGPATEKKPRQSAEQREEKARALEAAAAETAASASRKVLTLDEQIKRTQSYVFKVRMSILNMMKGGKLPGGSGDLDQSFAKLLSASANDYMKHFLALGNQQPPENLDEEAAEAHMAHKYDEFRTMAFVEQVLDRLEREIVRKDLQDHWAVINHLCVEMDLGHIDVNAGKTPFDPTRHEIDKRYANSGSDRLHKTVGQVIRSGYVDLLTASVVRKTVIRLKGRGE